jgi:hypothetical protein
MRAKVTTHVLLGRKSLGCPAGKLAAVGTIWEASKLGGPEHNGIAAASKISSVENRVRGKKREADQSTLGEGRRHWGRTRQVHSVGPPW